METRKRGRPRKKELKDHLYAVRLSEEESQMLEYLSERYDMPKSNVLRKSLEVYHNMTKNYGHMLHNKKQK